MLMLRIPRLVPPRGYGIARAIRFNSSESLDIEFGSLYPALKRLEPKGWVRRQVGDFRAKPAGETLPVDICLPQATPREQSKWTGFVSAARQIMWPFRKEASK